MNHVVPHAEVVAVSLGLAGDTAANDAGAVQAMFATYREQVIGEAPGGIEARARARWHAAGIDRSEVARRRDAVIERGRSQAGTD